MREIFSLGKLKGINLTRFSPQFSPHFSPHMSGARFTASTICTFFLEILKKISPVRSAELPKVVILHPQLLAGVQTARRGDRGRLDNVLINYISVQSRAAARWWPRLRATKRRRA